MAAKRRGRIRNELVGGLIAVILLSGLVTYAVVLLTSRRDFDTLVEKNDIDAAKSFAASLASFYGANGSWIGVEKEIEAVRHGSPSRSAPKPAADAPRTDKRHPRDEDIPLVLVDAAGSPVYSGIRSKDGQKPPQLPSKLRLDQGEKVVANGETVGYVFFKSMLFKSYNPQEEAFIAALKKSIGASVLFGLALALFFGTILASRFARPIAALDNAVKTIADGDMSARVGVARTDEIGRLAENFNVMADRLQVTEEARQNLLADIAHELRTPVSIIQANLEMIIDGVYAPDEARLKSLYEETRILTGLISDLRSLSDLEVGKIEPRLESVRLPALIEESCRKLGPLFDEKGISLTFPHEGDDCAVWADEDKLRQVLRNILGNALKYAPPDSSVAISLERAPGIKVVPDRVRVTIADEGEGVPKGDTEKIFQRFYRVDSSRSRESGGRGLGLAICKSIIEAFGGEIGAYNRSPRGLAVWFDLPIQA